MIKSQQEHDGAVDGSTPDVEYAYDDTAPSDIYTNGLRLESTTYPDDYVSFNDYGIADEIDDRLNRIQKLRETNASGTHLTTYAYNGTSRLVKTGFETTGSS